MRFRQIPTFSLIAAALLALFCLAQPHTADAQSDGADPALKRWAAHGGRFR